MASKNVALVAWLEYSLRHLRRMAEQGETNFYPSEQGHMLNTRTHEVRYCTHGDDELPVAICVRQGDRWEPLKGLEHRNAVKAFVTPFVNSWVIPAIELTQRVLSGETSVTDARLWNGARDWE